MLSESTRRIRQKAKKYNMSIKAVERAEKVKKCQICGKTFNEEKKNQRTLDHCHTSHKFRGVICNNCNLGLGYFADNQESLARAIAYLNKKSTVQCSKKIKGEIKCQT